MSSLDPNTPLLVGVGLVQQKEEDPTAAVEPIELMISAARQAGRDAGAAALLSQLDRVSVPHGRWAYQNPGGMIAEAVGSPDAQTVSALPGISQQTLMSDVATAIQTGEIKTALVVGGEAGYRLLRARIEGVEVVDTPCETRPDVLLEPAAEIVPEHEYARGLGAMAVNYYALIDSAWRHARGRTLEEHRDRIAKRYERFSQIAAASPHGWEREPFDAATIRDARILAFPYTKHHASNWNVDQASALLFTSVGEAERSGVPRANWIFPQAFSESNHTVPVSLRGDLDRCVGAESAAPAVLDAAGCGAADLDFIELYSCFPVAVELYSEALGLSEETDWSFTGAMPFGGGPFNNFVLHAVAQLAEKLRTKGQGRGLVTTVSGLLTKQGFAVWGTEANDNGFQFVDVTSEVAEKADVRESNADYVGPARVVGHTVIHGKAGRECGVIVVESPDGRRSIANSRSDEVMESMEREDLCGRRVVVRVDSFELDEERAG